MSRDGAATKLHARERVECYRDPGVRAGPLRILPRTTAHWIIVDERRPWDDQVIFITQRVGLRTNGDAFREAREVLDAMAKAEGLAIQVTGVL